MRGKLNPSGGIRANSQSMPTGPPGDAMGGGRCHPFRLPRLPVRWGSSFRSRVGDSGFPYRKYTQAVPGFEKKMPFFLKFPAHEALALAFNPQPD